MASDDPQLGPEDRELIERLARRVVELRMEVPAILTLETGKPLSLLAGQTMVFFEPIVQTLFSFQHYRRIAQLVERREVVELLIRRIERLADETAAQRRAAKRSPRPQS